MFDKDSLAAKIFPYAKWGMYGLLFLNMILFFKNQTIDEGIDSLVWLILLLLLERETSQMGQDYKSEAEKYLLQTGRFIAYILIFYSAYEYGSVSYMDENGGLDFVNAVLWIIVVLLIEYEIFYEKKFHQFAVKIFSFLKISLYIGLFIIAILWQLNGEWLDFYDAALWIVCFFFIELNILQFEDKISEEGTTYEGY
ncbi:MAG: hypothetical protein HY307_02120 [Arcobacter sp.]|nr:hypothetical protein [Arcobacter sp.]